MADRLERLEELLAAATPGPWERGDVWAWAGVQSGRTGPCALCGRMGAPVWIGLADINGTMMLAHKHRDPDPYGAEHEISSPDGLVCADWGGLFRAEDAALIIAARNALPDLVAVVKAAGAVIDAYDNAERESDWTGAVVDTILRAALATLRAES